MNHETRVLRFKAKQKNRAKDRENSRSKKVGSPYFAERLSAHGQAVEFKTASYVRRIARPTIQDTMATAEKIVKELTNELAR